MTTDHNFTAGTRVRVYTPSTRQSGHDYHDLFGTVEYVQTYKGRQIIGVVLEGKHWVTQFSPSELRLLAEEA